VCRWSAEYRCPEGSYWRTQQPYCWTRGWSVSVRRLSPVTSCSSCFSIHFVVYCCTVVLCRCTRSTTLFSVFFIYVLATRQCRRWRYVFVLSVRRVRPFVRPSGRILLPQCLMNGLSNTTQYSFNTMNDKYAMSMKLTVNNHFPDCLHGLLPGPFLLSFSVFVFISPLFFVSVLCAISYTVTRLSWPCRKLLSAR